MTARKTIEAILNLSCSCGVCPACRCLDDAALRFQAAINQERDECCKILVKAKRQAREAGDIGSFQSLDEALAQIRSRAGF